MKRAKAIKEAAIKARLVAKKAKAKAALKMKKDKKKLSS